jgi:hypothetical protein
MRKIESIGFAIGLPKETTMHLGFDCCSGPELDHTSVECSNARSSA